MQLISQRCALHNYALWRIGCLEEHTVIRRPFHTLFCLATIGLLAVSAAPAQDQPAADRLAPQSRAEEIDVERRSKAAELSPETPSPIEHVLNVIEEKKIIQRVFGGADGIGVRLGGLITGSGFAAGPQYNRHDLLHDQMHFRASAVGSMRKFSLIDMEANFSHLAGDLVFVDLYAVRRDFPHIDYYGPGAHSSKSGRTSFAWEDTTLQTTAGLKPIEHLRVGVLGRYALINIGPGRDHRFASTDQIYTDAAVPGLLSQPNFLEGGAFVEYDWRDFPEARRGGRYLARYTAFDDRQFGKYSFDRLDLEVQQYFSVFNQRRVLALRGRIEATDHSAGQQVPFYLQPTLGGSEDLRGFRPFRFYDNNAAILNGEYRWEVFSGLDMALFVDAGSVFPDWRRINFRELETDYGFGFRFNIRNDVFLRIDTGFSREGFQVWFKFNNVF